MSIGSWFTMEDIFAKIFTIKCFRQGEKVFELHSLLPVVYDNKFGDNRIILLICLSRIWVPSYL